MSTSPSGILEQIGGTKAVSEGLARPHTTVASWASRESIPIEAWPALIEMARDKRVTGVTYETLVGAHTEGKSPAPKPARPKRRRPADDRRDAA